MSDTALVWGAPAWLWPVLGLAALALLTLLFAYTRIRATSLVRAVCVALKTTAFLLLLLCLLEPLLTGIRPRPGANIFVMLADDSQSLLVRDRDATTTRAETLQGMLDSESDWQSQLGQDFDLRRYAFDTRLHAVKDFGGLRFEGLGSSLLSTLGTLSDRFAGRPVAGMLLFSDGNATDVTDISPDWDQLPPVYSVAIGRTAPARDITIPHVTVSQTNFESAPVSIRADVQTNGCQGEDLVVQLLSEEGQLLQEQIAREVQDDKPLVHRFEVQPEDFGLTYYRLRAFAESERELFEAEPRPEDSRETTTANNHRLVLVDRGGGPFRILYVSGRPNWEYKFLHRAVEDDPELQLVGLIRIARREPKFVFGGGRGGDSTNRLFQGFDNKDEETAEQYDQPVLVRLGTRDEKELSAGFPQQTDLLFEYDAVILDDLEAEFFSHDQMALLQSFVSKRGGGFLMLGGYDSFERGKYDRTPIGDLLPVYVDAQGVDAAPRTYRLQLTAEGWLQPWVRLRDNEPEEKLRLAKMPEFETLNRAARIKPGATVLAQVDASDGRTWPALVAQRFGRGRSAAVLLGDLWRWDMEREVDQESDLQKAWRQTLRWLVADVPQRIEVKTSQSAVLHRAVHVQARVRDELFEPLDNATVTVEITTPDGEMLALRAEASAEAAGAYEASYVPRQRGPYRARVVVSGPDGSDIGTRTTGWASEPDREEFELLQPNLELLERISANTGGRVVQPEELESFVAGLQNEKMPVTETWTYPLWHHWGILCLITLCLTGEWGLRRLRGLA